MRNAIPSAVYVLESEGGGVKIGRSCSPDHRRKMIECGGPKRMKLVHVTDVRDDASYVEATAHRLLSAKRLSGEWFDVSPDEAIEAILAAIEDVERRKRQEFPRKRKSNGPIAIYGDAMLDPITIRLPEPMMRQIDAMQVARMDQPDKQTSFSMRTEGAEGQAFLRALDHLRLAEVPQIDRTRMLKKLVFEAAKKMGRK